ncbi:MaoC family dehydratase [Haloarchaeobius baliensis]|uniref:MaoC family dehydratase n=1 Tax=Haloarchaeobius baliensis TaxID=1670458 RepID=UPI003F882573
MGERETHVASPFAAMATAWTSFAENAVKGATAANRAAFAAFAPGVEATSVATEDTTTSEEDEVVEASVPSVVYEHADWTFERTVEEAEDITVGDTVVFSKKLDEEDVRAFAAASGDTNRLHLDDEFAAETRFGGRIAHGTLVSGLVSAALARLPGLTIYLSQELTFEAPVGIGDRVTATVEVLEDLGSGQYRLSTVIEDDEDERVVIDGEAVVLIDALPE